MPGANEYITDPESREYKDLRTAADNEYSNRKKIWDGNVNYYNGQHKQWLKIGADGISDNVTINICKVVVDRKAAFLFPKMPRVILSDDGAQDENEKQLANDWLVNGGASLLMEMAVTGSLVGHVFARVVEGQQPKVVNLNPTNIIAFWNADNYKEVLWYEIRWETAGKSYRQDIVKITNEQGVILRWEILTFMKEGNEWKPLAEASQPWNYPLSPIVSWPHKPAINQHYGPHELNHAVLNDIVNLTASNIAKILRFHAHPLTVTDDPTISKDSFISTGPSKILKVKTGAKVYNVEMQSDLNSSMNFLNFLRDMFMEQSKVVVLPADVRTFANVTNFGVRSAFLPMIDDNEILRRQYSWGIAEISKRLLMLRGKTVDMEPKVEYADPLPTNYSELTSTLTAQYNAGFTSRQTAAEELGRDWQRENQRNSEDSEFAGILSDKFLGLQPPIGGL